jgi:hypothetical protein
MCAYLEARVQMPMAMKPTPAMILSVCGEMNLESDAPASTPTPAAATNAKAAPKNTAHKLVFESEANIIVASCVLSPISATNTEEATVKSVARKDLSMQRC